MDWHAWTWAKRSVELLLRPTSRAEAPSDRSFRCIFVLPMQRPLDVTLEELHDQYNRREFVRDDPIRIPHRFTSRDDREVAGFLTATIAWGGRKQILRSARELCDRMDNAPADFVRHASERDLESLAGFVHRTFNGQDLVDFVRAIRRLYTTHGGIGTFFESKYEETGSIAATLSAFRMAFLQAPHGRHAEKHLSSVDAGSACKRLNLYLRWFVRRDNRGVDFGLWRRIPPSALMLPLDVHTARAGRELGLLTRGRNDWNAVVEITDSLRAFDPVDPIRFDLALFGYSASLGKRRARATE